jgi:tetratricopeptide (TPR) repeat protein
LSRFIVLNLIFILLVTLSDLFAQQSRFDEANSLLEESRYQDAIQVYKSIADEGYDSGALWLNMGIAYSQLDSLGVSKFYLLKAQQYKETEGRAEQALFYVNERFTRQSAVLPPLPWDRFFQALSDQFGVSGLVYIALFFLYCGVALLIWSWFRFNLNKAIRYSSYSLLGISLLFFLFSLIVNYQNNRYGTGVMVERQGTVYELPREESAAVSTAYEGYKMRVDFKESENEPDWKYIRLENGMYGWVKENNLMVF